MYCELVSGFKYMNPKITTVGFFLKRPFVDVLSSCRSLFAFSLSHLTTTSTDGVSKERIDYGRAVSNCSKELALRNREIAYQKELQV